MKGIDGVIQWSEGVWQPKLEWSEDVWQPKLEWSEDVWQPKLEWSEDVWQPNFCDSEYRWERRSSRELRREAVEEAVSDMARGLTCCGQ